MATDYLSVLAGLLDNARQAIELHSQGVPDAVAVCQDFDRSWQGQLQRTRETFWADLEAPISTCTVCGQPMTTEHNRMPPEEHEKVRITRAPRSTRRPNNMRGRA